MPKLPFMRQGFKIADFGQGYSRLLKNSPPASPDAQGNYPGLPERLAEQAWQAASGTLSPANLEPSQHEPASRSKARYDQRDPSRAHSNVRQGEPPRQGYNPPNVNIIKMRQDFITM